MTRIVEVLDAQGNALEPYPHLLQRDKQRDRLRRVENLLLRPVRRPAGIERAELLRIRAEVCMKIAELERAFLSEGPSQN